MKEKKETERGAGTTSLTLVADENSKSINALVTDYLTNSANLQGFERAHVVALSIGKLKSLMTDAYMQPIMDLQGSRLGFRTDKDSNGGYDLKAVRSCVIEAVLMGVNPYGNQFNIIAGNTYITKEGFGELLKNVPNLTWWEVVPASLPRMDATKGSAAVEMLMRWSMKGDTAKQERKIEFPIKFNQYMGADGVMGKAERKARAWLYKTVTGNEIGDGDADDAIPVTGKSNGITTASQQQKVSYDDLTLLYEMKKHVLSDTERGEAQRIIDNKEEISFQKLYNKLQSL